MLINNLHRMEPGSRAGCDAQQGHWRHLAGYPFRDRVASGRASRSRLSARACSSTHPTVEHCPRSSLPSELRPTSAI
jgi:hypothetical protein